MDVVVFGKYEAAFRENEIDERVLQEDPEETGVSPDTIAAIAALFSSNALGLVADETV